MNCAHFGYEYNANTPFSSWTSSLAFLLSIGVDTVPGAHISMIDTKKLGPNNTVLFTPAMQILSHHVRHGNAEFMIYGPVQGPVHAAVSVEALRKGGSFIPHHSYRHSGFVQKGGAMTLTTAKRLGLLYGPEFALAFAAYAITVQDCQPDRIRTLALALAEDSELPLPREWTSDTTITSDVVFSGNLPEARNALEALRHMAQKQLDPGLPATLLEKRRCSSVRARGRSRVRKAVAAVTGADRMSAEAKKLYTAMIGWEDPVLERRLRIRQASKVEG